MDFLKGFEFANLIAPRDPGVFFGDFWGRRVMFEQRRLADFYSGLLSVDDVDRLVASGAVPGEHPGETELDVDAALTRLEQGAALVLDQADRRIATLGRLCRILHAELGFRCSASIEVTMPGNKPRPAEAPDTHLFVLQIVGRRHWIIAGPDGDEDAPGQLVMETGDLLYLPPGREAQHRTTGDASIMVWVTVAAPRWVDMTGNSALADDPTLTRVLGEPLPPGWLHRPRAELVTELSRRWPQAEDMMAVETAVDEMRETEVRAFSIDLRGRLTTMLQRREVTADTVFAARRDLLWLIEDQGHVIRLIAGPLTIDLAAGMREALEFCLRETRYTVADIPGDLDERARRALMDRLTQNVLVTRVAG